MLVSRTLLKSHQPIRRSDILYHSQVAHASLHQIKDHHWLVIDEQTRVVAYESVSTISP